VTVNNTAYVGSDEVAPPASGSDSVAVGKRTTSTTMTCAPVPQQINVTVTCTVVVTDTDTGSKSDPLGVVTFTSDNPSGIFAPTSCTLVSDGNPLTFTSSCVVTYKTPNPNVDLLIANYQGSTLHLPSSSDKVMTVFYDPSAGFVTGGGYILQTADMNPTGPVGTKANYGFNAKYKSNSNSTTLQGEVEFQFKPNLNFHSTTLDWLLVTMTGTPYRAQIQGSGTVNGAGNYGFLLTVTDGGQNDTFRIKIWNKADPLNQPVVTTYIYDDEPGRADNTYPLVPGTGGNIVIHK